MKKLMMFVCAVFFATATMAQSNDKGVVQTKATSVAKITFDEKSHDFGDIYQGDKVEYTFKFKNTGTEPLIISSVQTTCGCTATDWTKTPVAPGKTGEVAATFNSAGKMGQQNKVISVYSNAGLETVSIVTNILPAKAASAKESQK
jgi:hypothetical protein